MKLVVFGLTLTSSWGNGHATTYRALLRALAHRGHQIVFVEKDVEWYRSNRDLPEPSFCTVRLYQSWEADRKALLALARDADLVLLGSYFPDAVALGEALFATQSPPTLFYDIDTPITLAGLRSCGRTDYLNTSLIPHFAAYLSFTGGPALLELEQTFHACRAIPFYCSVDPALYHPASSEPRYVCDMSYLGTYAPDRQTALMSLLNGAAALLPWCSFRVAGPLYPKDFCWQPNVHQIPHIAPPDHPAFYSSSGYTLNLTRAEMIATGYSPSVRLFEASACGAAILSDYWPGLETFLTPGEEILIVTSAEQVARILIETTRLERERQGQRARERILAEHTSAHRALQFEVIAASL